MKSVNAFFTFLLFVCPNVMMAQQADRAMMIAVNGMLPNNSLGRAQLKRLRTYKDANHKQEAQKPVAYEL